MALTVLDAHRPVKTAAGDAEGSGNTVAGDGVLVKLDLDSDGRRLRVIFLAFADYAGLQTEWEAGSATTVLDSSIDTALASLPNDDELTPTQAGYMGTQIAFPI